MPGFYTHYLFGQRAFSQISNPHTRSLISQNKNAYVLGLQGPDCLFFFLPSYCIHPANIGSIMHEQRTGAFLYHLLQSRNVFFEKKDRQIAESYLLGFLGHYCLDSTCHPFVYSRTNFAMIKNQRYYSHHMELETEIDRELLSLWKRKRPSDLPQHKYIRLSMRQWRVISTMLNDALYHTYPEYYTSYALMKCAVVSMRLGTYFLSDHFGHKKPFLESIEKTFYGYHPISCLIPTDTMGEFVDPCNLCHDSWASPWEPDKRYNSSFLELFQEAANQYLPLLSLTGDLFAADGHAFDHTLLKQWKSLVGNRSYHTGKEQEH